MIDAEGLTKKFGDVVAVDGLTFTVNDGEVFGFLGPNGAGKTTTVRMLCCLISKTGGAARIAGCEVGGAADSLKIRKLIGLVPDNVGLYESLSACKKPGLLREALRLPRSAEEGEHPAFSHHAGALGEASRGNRPTRGRAPLEEAEERGGQSQRRRAEGTDFFGSPDRRRWFVQRPDIETRSRFSGVYGWALSSSAHGGCVVETAFQWLRPRNGGGFSNAYIEVPT